MEYTYRTDHIPTTTPYNRRPAVKLEPTTITIHTTGNPSSTAKNERAWLTNSSNTRTASYHIVMDEREAIEVLPLHEVGWHAGDGSGAKSGNRTSIGIELCESGQYELTVEHAAKLVARMLKERNWGVDRLRRHYDWSGKNCPRLMNTDGKWSGWTAFVQNVKRKLMALKQSDQELSPIAEKEENMLSVEDANKIIRFLSAAYAATDNREARAEFNRLANAIRKASGQSTQP